LLARTKRRADHDKPKGGDLFSSNRKKKPKRGGSVNK